MSRNAVLVFALFAAACSRTDCPAGTKPASQGIEHFCELPTGVRHGPYWRGQPGKVTLAGHYRNGKKEGAWTRHSKNGFFMGAFYMHDGTGVEIEWFEHLNLGILKYREIEYVNGVRDGSFTEWHPNGALAKVGQFSRGEASGTWLSFDDSGKLKAREEH